MRRPRRRAGRRQKRLCTAGLKACGFLLRVREDCCTILLDRKVGQKHNAGMQQSVKKPPQRADGESAVEFVAQRLRDGILYGRYAPGQRLIEAEATADHAVSRHTLRAALGRLAAEGLVETTPNRGA